MFVRLRPNPFYSGRQIILYHFEMFKVISVDTCKQFKKIKYFLDIAIK